MLHFSFFPQDLTFLFQDSILQKIPCLMRPPPFSFDYFLFLSFLFLPYSSSFPHIVYCFPFLCLNSSICCFLYSISFYLFFVSFPLYVAFNCSQIVLVRFFFFLHSSLI